MTSLAGMLWSHITRAGAQIIWEETGPHLEEHPLRIKAASGTFIQQDIGQELAAALPLCLAGI